VFFFNKKKRQTHTFNFPITFAFPGNSTDRPLFYVQDSVLIIFLVYVPHNMTTPMTEAASVFLENFYSPIHMLINLITFLQPSLL